MGCEAGIERKKRKIKSRVIESFFVFEKVDLHTPMYHLRQIYFSSQLPTAWAIVCPSGSSQKAECACFSILKLRIISLLNDQLALKGYKYQELGLK